MGRRQPTFSHGDKCAADFIKILYTSKEGYEAPTFDSLDTDGDGACFPNFGNGFAAISS